MNVRRILIPLDGSKTAESAIPEAVDIVRGRACTFVLLRVAQARILPGADVIGDWVESVREAEHYLATVKKDLEKEGIGPVEARVWQGAAAPAIIDAAQSHHADLIVMTSHGRSGISRLVFGSVAEAVLRGSRVPILLIRPTGAPVTPPADQGRGKPVEAPSRPAA
ncbi:MAG TPA: universal stress protein [Methylomirabilota bacterium]